MLIEKPAWSKLFYFVCFSSFKTCYPMKNAPMLMDYDCEVILLNIPLVYRLLHVFRPFSGSHVHPPTLYLSLSHMSVFLTLFLIISPSHFPWLFSIQTLVHDLPVKSIRNKIMYTTLKIPHDDHNCAHASRGQQKDYLEVFEFWMMYTKLMSVKAQFKSFAFVIEILNRFQTISERNKRCLENP